MDVGNTPHHTDIKLMTYKTSFLETCDEHGHAPMWAIKQIFAEHGSDLPGFQAVHTTDWTYGETILEWLGY